MLRNIPSAALKELVKLSERKEALMTRIQQIDREIMRVQDRYGVPTHNGEDVAPVRVSRAPRRRTAARRTERGALKERILRILRARGRKGATVTELAKSLGVPSANLYVWFSDTGRNIAGLSKVGPAKYRLI